MKRILFLALFLAFSNVAKAEFMFDLSGGYLGRSTKSGDGSTMEGHLFVGMAVGSKGQLYLGPSFASTKDDVNGASTSEIGARLNYYLNADKTYKIMLSYSPAVTATVAGLECDASSLLVGLGYEFKMNSNVYLGTVLAYHKLDAEAKTGGTDLSYNILMPMVNVSLRFK